MRVRLSGFGTLKETIKRPDNHSGQRGTMAYSLRLPAAAGKKNGGTPSTGNLSKSIGALRIADSAHLCQELIKLR
jgi:hypothetical protein